jgi:hypothetical protein
MSQDAEGIKALTYNLYWVPFSLIPRQMFGILEGLAEMLAQDGIN